jgi:hypothetical protein
MLSSLQQKLHCLLQFQLHFAILSFVTTTPLYKYNMKFFIFNGICTFHIVEVVLRQFHRCCYRSSLLWFFCWKGL